MIDCLLDGGTPQQALLHAGIDTLAAAKLLVEIGDDMTAFGSAGCLAKWAGSCPGNDQSAGKRRSAKTPKGNRYVRALLCEICLPFRKAHIYCSLRRFFAAFSAVVSFLFCLAMAGSPSGD